MKYFLPFFAKFLYIAIKDLCFVIHQKYQNK